MKASDLTTLAAAAPAAAILTSNPACAGIEVAPGHIQGTPTFAVEGTLLAIDEPSSMDTTTTFINGPAGPDWTDNADDGFSVLTGAQIAINEWRAGMWEPDGTPDTGDNVSYMFNKPGKSVTVAFDLPDGSIIHNVWATWFHQGNSGTGHTYTVDEGAPMTSAPPGCSWATLTGPRLREALGRAPSPSPTRLAAGPRRTPPGPAVSRSPTTRMATGWRMGWRSCSGHPTRMPTPLDCCPNLPKAPPA
jgi:hypothetical protein